VEKVTCQNSGRLRSFITSGRSERLDRIGGERKEVSIQINAELLLTEEKRSNVPSLNRIL
jgi:hypothetical protein